MIVRAHSTLDDFYQPDVTAVGFGATMGQDGHMYYTIRLSEKKTRQRMKIQLMIPHSQLLIVPQRTIRQVFLQWLTNKRMLRAHQHPKRRMRLLQLITPNIKSRTLPKIYLRPVIAFSKKGGIVGFPNVVSDIWAWGWFRSCDQSGFNSGNL